MSENTEIIAEKLYKSDGDLLNLVMGQMKSVSLSESFDLEASSSYSASFEDLEAKICQQVILAASRKESCLTMEDPTEGKLGNINISNVSRIFDNRIKLEDFILLKRVNAGGYGTIVLVLHKLYKLPLAIKIIRKEDMVRKNSVNRVRLEQQIFKRIEESQSKIKNVKAKFSDFVIRFYGSFKTDDFLFIVLDYCSQGDLGYMLKNCGAFGEEWSRQLIAEIIVGLSVFHHCGIVYNDLKPENILMSDDGHIKFTDFGISKIAVRDTIKTDVV